MICSRNLLSAVTAILPDIATGACTTTTFDESALWWELSCCLLSSQVSYSTARAAADAISASQLLEDRSLPSSDLEDHLLEILREPLTVDGSIRRYRFPHSRARQLAMSCEAIRSTSCNFSSLVHSFDDGIGVRAWLVQHASGFGPKQSSMFVRNIGLSYDLAIIDRHVVRYMEALDLHTGTISGMRKYLQCEELLRRHADELKVSVGILDWAVWIVMRMAHEITQGEH